jgi:PAS domain S-box-containing protein
MEVLPVGSISVDMNGLIRTADPWSEKLLGYERGSLKGTHVSTVFSDNGGTFLSIIQTQYPGYIGVRRIKTIDGRVLFVQVALVPGLEKQVTTLEVVFSF